MKQIWKSKKIAIILSYISIFAQTLSTIVLTRIYLNKLGAESYGLYQMIYSVAQYILILDLGISTTMIRFVAEFDEKNDTKKKENFLFHFLAVVGLIVIFVTITGIILNLNIEKIYTNLSNEDYIISHKLFIIMITQIIITVVSHYFEGITLANEYYAVAKLFDINNILLNIILVILFLNFDFGIIGIALAGTIVIMIKFLGLFILDIAKIKVKIKFHFLDLKMLKPAFILMIAMLLQSIIGHVNSSADKTILGIAATKFDVAVYSIAATFVTMFNALPSAISSVFQTKATKLVVSGAKPEKLSDFIIRPGRFQFIITGGFIAGFILFGKDFLICWAGQDMQNAWMYTLVIIIPNMIPLIQNVCLPILNAMDKRIFRSLILVLITIVNIILTVILINFIGPIGAPIATGIAYIIGHIIIMNIYYYKVIKLDIIRIFKEIFKRTFICIIITFLINIPVMLFFKEVSWGNLIIKAIIFGISYITLLIMFGLNDEEKNTVNNMIKKAKIPLKI